MAARFTNIHVQEVNGLKTGMKSVLWSAVALLLLLSIAVPVLNILTILCLMVPYVVLYTALPARGFILHMLPVWVVSFLILGAPALIIGLFFLVPSIVMGHMFKKQLPAHKVLSRTVITLLVLFLMEFAAFEVILDLSLTSEMGNFVRSVFSDPQLQPLLPAEWSDEYTEMLIQMMLNTIPLAVISVSFFYAVVTQYISRRVLVSSGIEVPRMPLAKDWMLPRVLVIYYVIVYILSLFVSPDSKSFLGVAVLNLLPLLRLAFAIQAVGFFFYLAHERKWNPAIPVLIAIPVLLFSPLSLIGVLDAAFPIRKSFTKKS
ncbi:DUF2232 domain-containing protein [Paenibacillus sp. FSL H8-0537]|uniref:DUF2232 domain-containing protein n=1 Tax=Paenibacillus sp. FSL H8-0537 TaxID=2921399 RepID=UPI0031018D57